MMMGHPDVRPHPAEDQFAHECLILWGRSKTIGGPKGYPKEAAFVPKARGVSVEWSSSLVEYVGALVAYCIEDEHRLIVRAYYQPSVHPKRNGERVQANMSVALGVIEREYKNISRDKVNQALDRTIGKLAAYLGYPEHLWPSIIEGWAEASRNK